MPPWTAQYIGLPFEPRGRGPSAYDCYGLVRLVMAEQFGIDLPSYAGSYDGTGREHVAELGRLVDATRPLLDLDEIPAGAERLGDAILLRALGQPSHIGLVIEPGLMLHTEAGTDSALADYTAMNWSRRVLGFYRHRGLNDAG